MKSMPWVSNGSGIIDQASTFPLTGVVHNCPNNSGE
jgi:hypothetical protein